MLPGSKTLVYGVFTRKLSWQLLNGTLYLKFYFVLNWYWWSILWFLWTAESVLKVPLRGHEAGSVAVVTAKHLRHGPKDFKLFCQVNNWNLLTGHSALYIDHYCLLFCLLLLDSFKFDFLEILWFLVLLLSLSLNLLK